MRYFVLLKVENYYSQCPYIKDVETDSSPQRKILIEDGIDL